MINDTFTFEVVFCLFIALIGIFISLNIFLTFRYIQKRKKQNSANSDAIPDSKKFLKIESDPVYGFDAPNVMNIVKNPAMQTYHDEKIITQTVNAEIPPKAKSVANKLLNISKQTWEKLKNSRLYMMLFKYKWLALNILLLFAIPYLFNDLFVKPLNVNYHNPKMRAVWLDQEEAFEIQFDRPIDTKEMGHDIHPDIKGKWVYEDKGIPFFKRKLKFIPEESILPDIRVQVYISNITNLYQTKPTWDKVMDFESPRTPGISSSYPENDGIDFGVDEQITLNLDEPDGKFVDWDISIEPEVEFEIVRNVNPEIADEERKQVILRFSNPLAQNQKYTLDIKKIPQVYDIKTGEILIKEDSAESTIINFTTVKAPAVSNIEPSGESVLADSQIEIKFDYDMVKEEVENNISFDPVFDYSIQWEDGKTIVIKPNEPFEKKKTYSFSLPEGLHNLKGGVSEEKIDHKFTIIGAVEVSSNTPGNNTTGRSINTNIEVTFNQEVDHSSAQSKFSISPKVNGKFSWDGNKMIFNPDSALPYQTAYIVTIGEGIKTIHGLDGEKGHQFKFTTESQVFSLAVPTTIQPYRYACNITAAKIALGYKGVNRSVDQLYAQVAKQNTPYNESTNTWGNPNAGYVGDINGISKGYGVHWGPIASLINANGRTGVVKSGWNTTDLLKEVQAGNPVIIWAHNGYSGSGVNTTWNLSGGGTVYTVKGMHSYVVRGYIGSVDNPTHILFSDPGRGSWTVSVSYFNSLWGTFGRSAVVVK